MFQVPDAESFNEHIATLFSFAFYFLIFVLGSRYTINHFHAKAKASLQPARNNFRSARMELKTTLQTKLMKQESKEKVRATLNESWENLHKRCPRDSSVYSKVLSRLESLEEDYGNFEAELAKVEEIENFQWLTYHQALSRYKEQLAWFLAAKIMHDSSLFEIVTGCFLLDGKGPMTPEYLDYLRETQDLREFLDETGK